MRISESLHRLRKEAQDEIDSPVHSAIPIEGKDLKKRQSLSMLLRENDEVFVRSAYRRILLREPDDGGFSENLSKLRLSRSTKLEILSDLYRSPEGSKSGIVLPGLLWRSWLLQLPFFGFWVRKIRLILEQPRQGALETLFRKHERATDEISSRLGISQQQIVHLTADLHESNKLLEGQSKQLIQQKDQLLEQTNQLVEQMNKLKELDKQLIELGALLTEQGKLFRDQEQLLLDQKQRLALQEKRSDRADERFEKANNHSKESSASLQLEIERTVTAIEEIRSLQERRHEELIGAISAATAPDSLPDEVYLAFENSFRGSREDVLQRLPVYFEYLPTASKKPDILDLGCGRGEWLETLASQSYHPKGVDLNRAMVRTCTDLGLDASHADALTHLRSLSDETIDVLSGFHLIEHLPLPVILALFEEAYRVLRGTGLLIFETPNPETLSVGAFTFHFDPTHRKPIPPALAVFYAENAGFEEANIRRLQEQWPQGLAKGAKLDKSKVFAIYRFFRSVDPDPAGLDFWVNSSATTNDLVSALSTGSDYALIAYKTKEEK